MSNKQTDEETAKAYEREVRVLRDWLIPSTLLLGICVSIILYVVASSPLTKLLISSAITASVSTSAFILNLILIFGALGDVEMDKYQQEVPSRWFDRAYTTSLIGIITFAISLALLCFAKSLLLGISSVISFGVAIIIFVMIAFKEE